MPVPTLHIAQGMCYVLFAYDIGLAIDLAACGQLLAALPERATLRPQPRTPQYVEYRPAPLYITQEARAQTVGASTSGTRVEIALYDFGAVSLTYYMAQTQHSCHQPQTRRACEAYS
jgi:hypothetical protein